MVHMPPIYSIGHSTRSLADFLTLLKAHGIGKLADVRTVPKSKRHPHFAGEALAASLADAGVTYRHFPGLGGLRKPRRDSRNGAWRNGGFRGYADYMATDTFEQALAELIEWNLDTRERHGASASARGTEPRALVIMCAEAVWFRCHRQLISDALVARGIEVRHIMTSTSAPLHSLTEFARVDPDLRVSYPGILEP